MLETGRGEEGGGGRWGEKGRDVGKNRLENNILDKGGTTSRVEVGMFSVGRICLGNKIGYCDFAGRKSLVCSGLSKNICMDQALT